MIYYPEFEHLKRLEDKKNPFAGLFEYDDGSRFYIEPTFYSQLMGFKLRFQIEFPLVLEKIEEVVRAKKRVVFTGDFENSSTNVEGYIFLEITDITNPLHLYVEDKSRGSDYGD